VDRVETLLAEGISAIKAGRRSRGKALLNEVVALHPEETAAWLWLACALDEPAEKERCLEQVLQLDPTNRDALRGLELIRREALQPPSRAPLAIEPLRMAPARGEAALPADGGKRSEPAKRSSRSGGKKSTRYPGAWVLAALISLANTLLLLAVARLQITQGGSGLYAGLWNGATAAAHAVASVGLIARRRWGRGMGNRLALTNAGMLAIQAALYTLLGTPEELMAPLCLLIAGDTVLATMLLAVRRR
jgi:hypothetical protein